jgi:putative ABC transport system permease protein
VVRPLDRKVIRDLRRIRLQAAAIAVVIGCGVLLSVMMNGLVSSLETSRNSYYERYRFADAYAGFSRGPLSLVRQAEAIEGVIAAEGRIRGGALVDVTDGRAPVRAVVLSLPDFGAPRLNDMLIVEGALPESGRSGDIVLLNGFARAHGLRPGDELRATLYGFSRTFRITALAEAPEFIYSAAPGELAPDDARFAVLWMRYEAMASAFDLDGAVNEILVDIADDRFAPDVLDSLDRLLDRHGGVGAYGRMDQMSHRFLHEEISGLRTSAASVPPIFMGVAAFLLYIVMARLIESERRQIGLLKAFGYSDAGIVAHYFKFMAVIALAGAALGCIGGIALGRFLADYYQNYYKLPFLVFRPDGGSVVLAVAFSTVAATAGGMVVLMRLFTLAPAEAMRPPTPADFSRSARLAFSMRRFLDQPSRMVARRLLRQPGRALLATSGIAAGMALSAAMLGVMSGFERMTDLTFDVMDRSDGNVILIEPRSMAAIFELQRIPGIIEAEPFRSVPVLFRNGAKTHQGALSGYVASPRLNRALTSDLTEVAMRQDGVILSDTLARKLGVRPGDPIVMEVREGRRPVLVLPVAATVESLLGAPAYLDLEALNVALAEPLRVSGAYLRFDPARQRDVLDSLKNSPLVGGVSLKADARASLQALMNQGAGATRYIMTIIAALITFGIVYNSARIAFAERAYEIASLRVLGFTRGEAGFVLLGEIGVITLAALPLGALAGVMLARAIATAFSTELYHISADIGAGDIALASIAVLSAAILSGWLVKRDADRIDLVSALKTRE